ncbi:CvpA family protein [Calditerricola satsumensis]|uniref:CvpA family protein n=1 Tax=Calditerricola satsumensis TaxID=373054 RepID=UPI0035712817
MSSSRRRTSACWRRSARRWRRFRANERANAGPRGARFGALERGRGFRRGLVRQAMNLVGLVAALLVARRYASDVAALLADRFPALGPGAW